jgi:hypothetical protein
MADELLLEDEIDRLIQRFGMPAVIAEFERRKKRHHAKPGAKPQKNWVYLIEMARIIYSPYQPRPERKKLQIGRVAGIIADRQKPKSRSKREVLKRKALIKTWKRQFLIHENFLENLLTAQGFYIQWSPVFDIYLYECARRLDEFGLDEFDIVLTIIYTESGMTLAWSGMTLTYT